MNDFCNVIFLNFDVDLLEDGISSKHVGAI
jgi:hypothetical protein